MILNTELSHDAEYIGDIQENRVGIDKSNLDFITTLLTSNLYSKPLESFLRETVANAYDSHMEAGTDEHILLLIQDSGYKTYTISIRDYGVGVSPERFEKIYMNIGSSTKRDSNDYIGMFGIGRFSCLSCADVANITSYYNGKKYSYLMYKNGGGINIDKILETEGDFKNGLEVSVKKFIFSDSDWKKAIHHLCLFDKLHITYQGENHFLKGLASLFNERKITNFNAFSRCSLLPIDRNYFKVGNVLYDMKDMDGSVDLATIDGLIISLPIGSVDITPNREALQYTDYTNRTINQKVAETKMELQDMVNTNIKGDISMSEFFEQFCNGSRYTIKVGEERFNIDKKDVEIDSSSITIGGEPIPDGYDKFLNYAKYVGIDKSLIHKGINKSMYGRRTIDTSIKQLILGNYVLVNKLDKVTKQVTWLYFTDHVTRTSVVLTYDGLESFKADIEKLAKSHVSIDGGTIKKCVDFLFKNIKIDVMSNDSVPYSYVEAYKAEQRNKRKKVDTGEVLMRTYHRYGYTIGHLSDLPNKGLVIYSTHTQDDYTLKQLSDLVSYTSGLACVITVKSEYIKLLEGNKRFMTVENFMFLRNSMLSKIVTALAIKRNFYEISSKYNISPTEMPIYREFVKKYKEQIQCLDYWSHSETRASIFRYYENKGWVNQCDIAYFSLTEKEAKSYKGWKDLEEHRYDIVRQIAYKKYGRLPRIGLIQSMAPKLT